MLTTPIQFYKNALDNIGKPITVQQAFTAITTQIKTQTSHYRTLPPGKEKDKAKKQFSAVAWSGTFSKRSAKSIEYHSGLICIDIDKLDAGTIDGYYKLFCKDAHTALCFISPSGNGIKILFKININNNDKSNIQAQHLQAFQAIEKYFMEQYSLAIDTSGKDVSRLCFLCYHPTAYINADSTIFNDEMVLQYTNAASATIQPASTTPTPQQKKYTTLTTSQANSFYQQQDTVESVEQFTNNKLQLTSGNRNNWLYLFACNCNRKGIEYTECLSHATMLCNDKDTTEITNTIRSAYTHHAIEFGKYKKQNNETNQASKKAFEKSDAKTQNKLSTTNNEKGNLYGTQAKTNSNNTQPKEIPTIKFWNTTINEKTGKENVNLYYTNFYKFLESKGFYNLKIDTTNVDLVHIENNIVSPVMISKSRNDVKHYCNEYCKENELWNVLEMLHKGTDKYFARGQFVNIGYKQIEFFKDSKNVSFHFHNNGVVNCTKDGINFTEYEVGDKMLWKSQINNKNFKRVPVLFNNLNDLDTATQGIIDIVTNVLNDTKTPCIFAQYQICASSNPHKNDVTIETKVKRFLAHATSFGYLINNYKPAIGKAIVGTDHHISLDRKEQMGRTGKGILSKAIGHITKRFAVDGRKFDPKDQSVFENLQMDSKVITVDDCHARFDFGHFFVPITEDFTIRKMYLGYITIPYDDSQKWYFNTNFTFKGDGDSFSGRQHIIEFDDFFNKEYTPIHHFSQTLFKDWDEDQWNLFYNYAYECDCLYKQLGLVEYAEGNYLQRKLTNECPQEFIDFIEAYEEHATSGTPTRILLNFSHHKWIDKKTLLEQWTKEAKENNMQTTSAKGFYNMLNQYCKTNNIGFYTNKAGGKECYWIGTDSPSANDLAKNTTSCKVPAPNQKQIIKQAQLL